MKTQEPQILIPLTEYETLKKRCEWTYLATREHYGEIHFYSSPEITVEIQDSIKELFEKQNGLINSLKLENIELMVKLEKKSLFRRIFALV